MLLKHTIIKPSPISGLGCFLTEPVSHGETIWVFSSKFDLLFSQEEFDNLDPVSKELVHYYGYLDNKQFIGYWILHSGNDRFCNHSNNPSMVSIHLGGCKYIMVASRDLFAGDELTCDYKEYNDLYSQKIT